MTERVAVVGVGVVCALGVGARDTFRLLTSGTIAVGKRPEEVARIGQGVTGLPEVPIAAVSGGVSAQRSRTEALGLQALAEAHEDAGGAPPGPVGLVWGTTTGGLREAEECLAGLGPEPDAEELAPLFAFPISGLASRSGGVLGRIDRLRTVCSACSSGALATATGAAWIAAGICDRVYVGGADALCATTLLGFGALGLLDPNGGRPFDRDRAGLSLGEGAGCLVLERAAVAEARGARILAWLDGWACGAEAFHITQPEPGGHTSMRLMRAALQRAGREPADIGYVNAHGTGTVRNDDAELEALGDVFGRSGEAPRVSSNKAQLGHALGAAGAIEAVYSVLSLEAEALPPNARLAAPDHPKLLGSAAERARCRAVLSNSFGFGGMDAVLCISHAGSPNATSPSGARRVFVTRSNVLAPAASQDPLRVPERAELVDPDRSRRFDPLSVLVSASLERCLDGVEIDPQRNVGVFHGAAFGLVGRAQRFLERARKAGAARVPPVEFPLLLPSAASGNASIYANLHGPAAAVSRLVASAHAALHAALDCVSLGEAHHAVSVATEPMDELSQRAGRLLFSISPATRWCAAAQLVQATPSSSLAVAAREWGESGGELPTKPAGSAVAFLGGNDGSAEVEWGDWPHPPQPEDGSSIEGLGGLAIERCLEELRQGRAQVGLVVDVVEDRVLFTLFERVSG